MMYTPTETKAITPAFTGRVATLVSPETRRLVGFGRDLGWEVSVLGWAPMLEKPVRLGDWLMVPAHQDSSPVPTRALERVQAIYAAGFRPQGLVLVHEAPLLLTAPRQNRSATARFRAEVSKLMPTLKPVVGALGALLVGLAALAGVAVLIAAAVAAVAVAAALALPLLVVGAMVDPILVAVTEDGFWVEIDRWSS